jgi:hypothetical protein
LFKRQDCIVAGVHNLLCVAVAKRNFKTTSLFLAEFLQGLSLIEYAQN